jgi:CheY-like chemotaxis protein
MNTPLLALPIATLGQVKKKRVLLVDTSHPKRELRAEIMRKLGMDVDCAADIAEARSWWRADLYDLVLINMDKGRGHRDRFCDDIRSAMPPQRLAFLVGKPEYLADAPCADDGVFIEDDDRPALMSDVKAALAATLGGLTQRWGILEASRRISAVRSACSARSQAMRDRPIPPRDSEGTRAPKLGTLPTTLDDLLREEMR